MYLRKGQKIPQRQLPKFDYRGLTIVMSNPSRFDGNRLLSANGGQFAEEAMSPEMLINNCEVRLFSERSPLIKDTKCILLLGERAMHEWCPETRKNTLNEQRGSMLEYEGIPAIATYLPQEATDPQDYEGQKNILAQQSRLGNVEDDDRDKQREEKTRHGRTKPQNWMFWCKKDIQKAVTVCEGKLELSPPTDFRIFPTAAETIEVLNRHRGDSLYFDLETDEDNNILCLAFGFEGTPIYGVPFLTPQYKPYYQNQAAIFAAFAKAYYYNEAVAHNGSGFDFRVLARRYGIGFGARVYDTMLAHFRCFPKVEKSLGHCTSLWTSEPYHKDESDFSMRSHDALERLIRYCCKDVYSMKLVRHAIDNYAAKVPGLPESIAQVNSCIKPYLTTMLQGVKVDNEARKRRSSIKDREATQYMRIMRILTGPNVGPLISNQKCVNYFHRQLGYPVVKRTSTNNASLDRASLLKLAVRYPENPVFNVLIKYREAVKESSMLQFVQLPGERTTTSYDLAGPYTFRLASQKFRQSMKKGDEVGGNMQNWAKDTRECITADPGKKLLQIDQAGAEALIVAYLCRAGTYRELFEAGVKCHTFVALHTFPQEWRKKFGAGNIARALDCSPKELVKQDFWPDLNKYIKSSDDWPTSKRFYYIGKRISHSSNYGASWSSFQQTVLVDTRGDLVLSPQDCRQFMQTYHGIFPEIREWHERTRYQVLHFGVLYNLFGYPCEFFDNKTIRNERDWFAFVGQSTVGCITNIAFVKMYEYIAKNKLPWDLLGNNHDSYLLQFPEEDQEHIIKKGMEFITPSFKSPFDGTEFRMKAEAQVGLNWGIRKEKADGTIINPNGLVEV